MKHLQLEAEPAKLDFNDVLIVPSTSTVFSRKEVNLQSRYLAEKLGIRTTGIIAANMDGVGTFEVAKTLKSHGIMTALTKHYDITSLLDFFSTEDASHAFYSMGMSQDDTEKFDKFYKQYKAMDISKDRPLKVCLDVANGYLTNFHDFCREMRDCYPELILMAGNVVDANGASHLEKYADFIKVGIGPGSNCLTRSQTGIGYPRFSAIYDIIEWQYEHLQFCYFGKICSDGGCVTPGDVVKAMAAGATLVMIGGMFAGCDEGGGDIIEKDGKQYVMFYGMSSKTAQHKHNGGLNEYRSSEGRTTLVPYKGSINDVAANILGGLRSACTYVGANSISELKSKSKFIRVNNTINRSMESLTIGN